MKTQLDPWDEIRLEAEKARRSQAIRALWELAREDVTVHSFLVSWRNGDFPSFEEAVCQLAVVLSNQKLRLIRSGAEIEIPPTKFSEEFLREDHDRRSRGASVDVSGDAFRQGSKESDIHAPNNNETPPGG